MQRLKYGHKRLCTTCQKRLDYTMNLLMDESGNYFCKIICQTIFEMWWDLPRAERPTLKVAYDKITGYIRESDLGGTS